MNEYFVAGFVKQAISHGWSEEEALGILKQSAQFMSGEQFGPQLQNYLQQSGNPQNLVKIPVEPGPRTIKELGRTTPETYYLNPDTGKALFGVGPHDDRNEQTPLNAGLHGAAKGWGYGALAAAGAAGVGFLTHPGNRLLGALYGGVAGSGAIPATTVIGGIHGYLKQKHYRDMANQSADAGLEWRNKVGLTLHQSKKHKYWLGQSKHLILSPHTEGCSTKTWVFLRESIYLPVLWNLRNLMPRPPRRNV